jgi:hypothetical protein
MQVVKMSLIALIIILFSGCFGCELQMNKCVTPNVAKPIMDNNSCKGNAKCVFEKTMVNYETMVKYAEDLLDANRVCK